MKVEYINTKTAAKSEEIMELSVASVDDAPEIMRLVVLLSL